jgi:pyridinium-3,5-bisthiocarboxylic acid mononucleotide nickel chelatase
MSCRSIKPPEAMLHIHLDAVGGIAGDMFVAALLDAFPDFRSRVLADARAVLPAGYEGRLRETRSGILRGLGFGLAGEPPDHGDNDHHGAGGFLNMMGRIRTAALADGSADQAVAILTLIAEVEATIHQVPIEEVHFHEIADWDSLLDVVAAGSIAAALSPARWTVSPLPRGGGLVKTRHGLLPVPAPATAALLTGFAWRDDGVGGERVTPTGAAILRHLVGPDRSGFGNGSSYAGRLVSIGTGAGTRILSGIPNVLRALVFEAEPAPAAMERIMILSFEIDDMTGEEIGVAADRLRTVEGVLDLSIGQVQGKKGRLMQSFRLLVVPDQVDAVIERCFLETSTIGLRVAEEQRVALPRQLERAEADGIEIGIKTVERGGGTTTKAESDDLAADSLAARRRLKRLAEEAPQ